MNYLLFNENRIVAIEAETGHRLVLYLVDDTLRSLVVAGRFCNTRTLGQYGIAQCEQQKYGRCCGWGTRLDAMVIAGKVFWRCAKWVWGLRFVWI